MTSAAQSFGEQARPARSPWFFSAPFDLLLILGVPFLTWPLLTLAQDAWGAGLLNQLILLTASGHYFATFVRAYGDRELFERFKLRFLLAPPLLLAMSIALLTSGNFAPLVLVTAFWAFWHWLAQAFGFARIYDSKVGSFRPLTAWLDKALVITGFVGTVTLNDGAVAMFGKLFLDAGIGLPTAAQFAVVQAVVGGAVVLVGGAYAVNLAVTIARGQPWSWQKQFMHVTTIGYYWFAFAWLPNVLIAHVLYELFHDIQYYAITWITCRHRVQRPGVTSWLGRMFRPGWLAAAGFVLLMTAFGAVDLFGRSLSPTLLAHQLSLALFLTAALLHYYYDGFIWKARESSLGKDLGIATGLRASVVPGLRHAGRWALFVVPLLGVMAFGGEGIAPRARAEALVGVAPGDFLSQSELALALVTAGEMPAALEHYRASIAANPDYAQAHANYGAALDLEGDLAEARAQYERALECPDQGGAHRQAHINLGVLLLVDGDSAGAQRHFDAGLRMGGVHPIDRMLGVAARLPAAAADRRMKLYSEVLKLEPQQLDARYALAGMLLEARMYEGAASNFTALLQRAPNSVAGLVGLATAQVELGQLTQARTTLQRALQVEPGNEQARQLMARIGGG